MSKQKIDLLIAINELEKKGITPTDYVSINSSLEEIIFCHEIMKSKYQKMQNQKYVSEYVNAVDTVLEIIKPNLEEYLTKEKKED